jgi:hypothetical protein
LNKFLKFDDLIQGNQLGKKKNFIIICKILIIKNKAHKIFKIILINIIYVSYLFIHKIFLASDECINLI